MKATKLERIKALRGIRGIQNLLNAGSEVLGNPLAMFDTEYRLQAYTHVESEDRLWNELITHGKFSHESQAFFAHEGFTDATANTATTAPLPSDKLKYDRISGKLYNEEHIYVSNLILVASNQPLEEGDEAALAALCDLCSREIAKSQLFETYGRVYRGRYIKKLLDGELKAREMYIAHVAIVDESFASNMRLVAADIGTCDPTYGKLGYFRDCFRSLQKNFVYAIYQNYLLIIIDAPCAQFRPKRDLKKLYAPLREHGIAVGASESFDNLFHLRRYYEQALEDLKNQSIYEGN